MIQKVLGMIALCYWACGCASPSHQEANRMQGNRFTEAEEQPAEVKVLRLERRDFNYELISNGTVMAMHKAELRFPSQDMVQKIYVRNGERVTAGQKIAEQDKFRVEMAMKQAREALEQAKLDLQDALIGQGFAWSDSLNIPAEVMRIARIRSNYDYCLNQFTNSRHQFEEATLVAPFSGVVANIVVKEYNLPGGNPFCTIIDNQHPEVVFSVLENELPLINPGDRLLLSPFSQPDYTVEGRITEINPVIDRNGMVRVKASVSNRDNRFYEGMNVKVRVQRLLGDRLVIPKSALLLRNNRKVVFTLKGDRAQWVYVETAQENTDSYVVTEKLQAGDSVIYEGNLHLAHEAQVVVVN